MFDDIIINILSKKALNQHVEVVDIYFTKTGKKNIFIEDHFNIFIGRKVLIKVLIFYVHISMLKTMTQFLSNIIIWYTQSDAMKENLDYWLDKFEKFHQKYIIIPTESSNYSFPEESRYIVFTKHPAFINQEKRARCYFNETIQLLYWIVLFRKLTLNIYCSTMMDYLDKDDD